MKYFPTKRQKDILKTLRAKDAGQNLDIFLHLEKGNLTSFDVETLCSIINSEFMMEGILPTFEPNNYGLELEELLDSINGLRLNK